jgi:hypothetical protein
VNFRNNAVTDTIEEAYGGGIGVTGNSSLFVDDSRFVGNSAASKGGGGIGYRDSGSLQVHRSLFENNSAPTGAGIFTQSDGMQIVSSLFLNNDATSFVGAVDIGCGAEGSFEIRNSTFVNNEGNNAGAILSCASVSIAVAFSTFVDNTPSDIHLLGAEATATLGANIFAALDSADVDFCSGAAGFTSNGDNVWQSADAGCGATSDDDFVGAPQLMSLADNGGALQTIGLQSGSPAIDWAAGNPLCPETDQRGYARPAGSGCDSGAFEHAATPSQ